MVNNCIYFGINFKCTGKMVFMCVLNVCNFTWKGIYATRLIFLTSYCQFCCEVVTKVSRYKMLRVYTSFPLFQIPPIVLAERKWNTWKCNTSLSTIDLHTPWVYMLVNTNFYHKSMWDKMLWKVPQTEIPVYDIA